MSPDTVLLTGQRDPRRKASLVRENPWFNFQISKISRTHWKKQEKSCSYSAHSDRISIDCWSSAFGPNPKNLILLWKLVGFAWEKTTHCWIIYSGNILWLPIRFGLLHTRQIWESLAEALSLRVQETVLWAARAGASALSISQGLCAQYWLGKCAVV